MPLRSIQRRSWVRALPGTVLLLTLLTGCANTPPGTGGSGSDSTEPTPPGEDTKALAEAGRAEAAQVAAEVWAVAGGVRDVGSRLVFTFWSERGALTLTGYQAVQRGGRPGRPADGGRTERDVAHALRTSLQQRTGEVALTLRRGESSWEVEPHVSFHAFAPAEARRVPGRRGAFSPGQSAAVAASVRHWLEPVEVPADGTVWVDLSVRVRDGRVVGWDLEGWRVIRTGRGGKPRPVSEHVANEVAHVVRLYAPGAGTRSIHLGLRLSHRDNAQAASGWVEETRVAPQGLATGR